MKWFKHQSLAHQGETLRFIYSQFGHKGQSVYWRLLGIIASRMDSSRVCHCEYPIYAWCRELNCAGSWLRVFLSALQDHDPALISFAVRGLDEGLGWGGPGADRGLTRGSVRGDQIMAHRSHTAVLWIECRKLLQNKDEYAQKSGQYPERVGKVSVLDKELDKDKEEDPPIVPRDSEKWNANTILEKWNACARIKHQSITAHEKAIARTLKQFDLATILRAIERYGQWWLGSEVGRYRKPYSWTLSQFLTREGGAHVERLASEGWESGCAPFGKEGKLADESWKYVGRESVVQTTLVQTSNNGGGENKMVTPTGWYDDPAEDDVNHPRWQLTDEEKRKAEEAKQKLAQRLFGAFDEEEDYSAL